MLGGLLHAAHVPFRGMIISSAAVIIICLIAHFSVRRGEILKATIIVLLIKAAVSPHTPVAAYGSVFLQGLLGEGFFFSKRFYAVSSIMFGIVVGILTGLQRLITLTLIFGITFWDAINQFLNYVIKEFFISSPETSAFNFSLVLMTSYVLIHLVFGFAAGVFASKMPVKINSESAKDLIVSEINLRSSNESGAVQKMKRKLWWSKPSYIASFIFSAGLLIISYTNPQAINLDKNSILVMLIRSVLIMLLWFYFLSPILLTFIKRLLHKRQNDYTNEITSIINHFPIYKNAAAVIWRLSAKQKGFRRLNYFMVTFIINVLILKFPE
jgi:hypothetical protein